MAPPQDDWQDRQVKRLRARHSLRRDGVCSQLGVWVTHSYTAFASKVTSTDLLIRLVDPDVVNQHFSGKLGLGVWVARPTSTHCQVKHEVETLVERGREGGLVGKPFLLENNRTKDFIIKDDSTVLVEALLSLTFFQPVDVLSPCFVDVCSTLRFFEELH